MINFSQFGNDLYTGRRSIDFIKRQKTWYAVVRRAHRAGRSSASSPADSTSASSSAAAPSSGSRA